MSEILHDREVGTSNRLRRFLGAGAVWLATAAAVSGYGFFHEEHNTSLAGNAVTISPTLDSYATFNNGLAIPSARYPLESRIGVTVDVRHSNIPDSVPQRGGNIEAITSQYAAIAAQPDGEITKIHDAFTRMAYENVLKGGIAGIIPLVTWALLGQRRRRELRDQLTQTITVSSKYKLAAGLSALSIIPLSSQPIVEQVKPGIGWYPAADIVPQLRSYAVAHELELRADIMTGIGAGLLKGAFDTYASSKNYYGEIEETVTDSAAMFRQPEEDERVALMISDRHDNIGMDPVARAVAEAAHATLLLNAGDDTSTGASWERFSLDSLLSTFDDFPVIVATGNHDNTPFVARQYKKEGALVLEGQTETVEGITFLGASDPRYSDVTPEKREGEQTLEKVADNIADIACGNKTRISTILVHDRNMGDEALRRGCVDLVLGGHDHKVSGPDRIIGQNDQVGYGFTNGTTGGAATSFALRKDLLRESSMTLVTYKDARPFGMQIVTVTPAKTVHVSTFKPFAYPSEESKAQGPNNPQARVGS